MSDPAPNEKTPSGPIVAPRTRSVLLGLVTVLGLLMLFGVGRKVLISKKKGPDRKPPPAKVRVVEVTVAKPSSHEVTVSGNAAVAPARVVNLVSEVSGRVLQAHPNLRAGGFIKKGELLFQVDRSDMDISVKRLEAEIKRAKARVGILRVQRSGAKGTLKHAEQAVALTQKQLARDTKLAADGHLAAASADRTRLELTGQRDRLRAAKTTSGSLPHQITEARAQIAAAEQQLAAQNRLLERTTLSAEFDLQVRSGGLEEGTFVSIGQPIAVLEDVSAVELAYPLPLDELLWLTRSGAAAPESRHGWADLLTGRSVVVRRGPKSPYQWAGTVHRVGAGLTEKTRMIEVYVRVTDTIARPPDGPPLPLLPGMFCNLSITGRTLNSVFVLPRKSIQPDGDIYLVGEDDTLHKRAVHIVVSEGDNVIIDKGLKAGERVILTSLPGAVAGMELRVRGDKRSKKETGKDVADR